MTVTRSVSRLALALTLLVSFQPASRAADPVVEAPRAVDVVVVLDASGSMEDLLDAVRARIWDVVGELARMRPTPELRVGLITFGTTASAPEDGWIVEHADLTDDLDTVYARLMAVKAEGSEEYVGRALHAALDRMSWSAEWNALRVIFVAGNESADQGAADFDFRIATRTASDRDIVINALYAGNREQAVVEQWPEVARLGAGNFSAIDPKVGGMQIATPQDDALLSLNRELISTYVPYGPKGQAGLANQIAQDANASRLGVQSCSSRIVAKGSSLYTNASWDLVDATLQEGFRWDSLGMDDLPEEMRAMTDEARIAHVDAKRAERESIQTAIQELSAKREAYIRGVRDRELAAGIGEAMKQVIREQAKAKGFTCDEC